MAVLLAVIGTALYLRFEKHLDDTINEGLRSRADVVSTLIQRDGGGRLDAAGSSVLVERAESFTQILDDRGAVVDASPRLGSQPLLTVQQDAAALRRPLIVNRPNPIEPQEPSRLLATAVKAGDRRLVVVVGTATDDRVSQLHNLIVVLTVGGAIALLLASLAGYGAATAALRPVDAMRRKADEITEEDPGERLPVGMADDEIKRLGTTLNRMLVRLERAVDRERAFVADASHELRTPLAILKAEIELALRGDRSQAQLREALESAAEETDRLAELAEALLVIARAEGGRLPLMRSPVQPAQLLEDVAVRFRARLGASERALVVGDVAAVTLDADPRRLEQALDNLVENALQHGDGTIHLGAAADNGTVVLHVRDEGPGFPPEFIDEAFERFTRADHARGRGGAGLGLSIVQLIARAHGGEARAENDPGGGARVSIELPIGRGATAPAGEIRSPVA
ncbi:MAG TPA: ATP-binding protein [Solirubrobacteraceae bacterium]|nr:ATP-binding protein [Solirubrobacteraceae bacterium]